MDTTSSLAEQLRAWARGLYPTEAGVELLVRAFDGQLARRGLSWVVEQDERAYVDADALAASVESGAWSGGERRVLTIVASLLDDERTVSLNDVLPGLDRPHLELVLAAVAHAAGSHEQNGLTYDDDGRPAAFPKLASAYPWPSA